MAASSSNTEDDDPSLALALALQAEDDAALARNLMHEEEENRRRQRQQQQTVQSTSAAAATGPLPGERLAGAAHKSISHLGKNTCKKLAAHFLKGGQTTLSLAELLRLFRGPQREELLMLCDAGQRQRIEAELVAADLDFPAA